LKQRFTGEARRWGAERRREVDEEIESVIDELEADSLGDDQEVAVGPMSKTDCASFVLGC